MRILCLSDLHNDRAAAVRLGAAATSARADLIVSAGDLASDGVHHPGVYSALRAAGPPVLCVPGNHDGATMYATSLHAAGFVDLHRELREHAGWTFAGWGVHSDAALPGADESRQEPDPALSAVLSAARQVLPDRLVLVTHVPPRGTGSAVDRRGVDRGSVQLRRWIEEVQPGFVICGHVHHREVVLERVGRTLVVNPGPHGHVLDMP